MPDERIFVGVAGNEDPERVLPEALERLAQEVAIVATSTFYRTPPLHRADQADYLNGVVEIRCDHAPLALKSAILRPIEAEFGRVRTEDLYASRPLDLDILVFGERVITIEELTVPDPDIYERPFLAAALDELAPDLVLPDTGRAVAGLLPHKVRLSLLSEHAFTAQLKKRLNL